MFEQLRSVVEGLRVTVRSLETGSLTGEQAARLVELFDEAERLAGAGRGLAARRVEETNLWRQQGHRSAAHWMAATTGTSVGAAVGVLETARRLDDLPAVADAYREGRLSEVQVKEIASAAVADPRTEQSLLEAARTNGVAGLREQCRRVRATGDSDQVARHQAIRRSRYLRHWCEPDGAFRLDMRTTVEDGAVVLAALRPHQELVFREARGKGQRESPQAYAADALVALARSSGHGSHRNNGPRAMVHVRVDHAALKRGHIEDGEVCEVPGVGPIAVATARELMGDAIVEGILTEGVQVRTVAHLGRTVTAHQRRALEARDPECAVSGCHVRDHLEIDHVDGWALTRVTTVDRLARLCRFHHHLKTYCGYRLEGEPGAWRWLGPDDGDEDRGRAPPDGLELEFAVAGHED